MKVSFESKGNFGNALSWLKGVINHNPLPIAKQIANEGTKNLMAGTPRDTGETASGWTSEIKTRGGVTEIAWKNNAHPYSSANVAKLIELGHGTKNGGYVQPRPYIKNAMNPVFANAGDKVVKGLIK